MKDISRLLQCTSPPIVALKQVIIVNLSSINTPSDQPSIIQSETPRATISGPQ